MSVLPAYMSEHRVRVWCLKRPEENIGSPAAGDTDIYEPLCGCEELNPSPLLEQYAHFALEPSL